MNATTRAVTHPRRCKEVLGGGGRSEDAAKCGKMKSKAVHREPHLAADRMPNAWHGAQPKGQRTDGGHRGSTNAAPSNNNPASREVELGRANMWYANTHYPAKTVQTGKADR